VLLSDNEFPYSDIINETHSYIIDIFESDIKFVDFRCNSKKGTVGYTWFMLRYVYIPNDFLIEIEHDRGGYMSFCISDPRIALDNNIWSCQNNVWNIINQTKGVNISSSCTNEAMRIQVNYLYDILVKRTPPFYPIKYKIRAKTPEGQKYWVKYWEEHPLK
jgi:hypothetical protein